MLSYDRTNTKKGGKMGNIGIKKEIDRLGRICIPKEMRRLFNLESEVELQITDEGILLKSPEYILVKRNEYEKPSELK